MSAEDVSSAPRIAVVGSANVDLVARCERLPRPGETVTDAQLDRVPGGKGANQAVACARLGARVRFVGRIGTDDLVLRSLEREGVDVSGVVRDEGETGVALVVVDASGENLIVVAPGANARLRAEDVHVGESDAVMCQLEIPPEALMGGPPHSVDLFSQAPVPAALEGASNRPDSARRRATSGISNAPGTHATVTSSGTTP